MTNEELEALPEAKDWIDTIDPDTGITTRTRIALRFRAYKPKPDDILLFSDRNGQSWFVDHHLEGGPYKRRA